MKYSINRYKTGNRVILINTDVNSASLYDIYSLKLCSSVYFFSRLFIYSTNMARKQNANISLVVSGSKYIQTKETRDSAWQRETICLVC